MKRVFRTAAIVLAAMALAACLERKEIGMINPDGSGKIVIDTLVAAPAGMGDGGTPDIALVGKQFATGLITKSSGVDAWKGVVVETAKDGRAHVAATAYFSDVSKLRLDIAMPMHWTKEGDGNFLFSIGRDGNSAGTKPASKMTDEEVAERVRKAKAEYKDNQAVARAMLSTLKIDMAFTLPGPVTGTNIFGNVAGSSTVTLAIDGGKVLESLDKMMADDKAVEESVRSAGGAESGSDGMLERMFGKKGPISATVGGPGKILFDYKSEMEAAKAGEGDVLRRVGIELPAAPETAPAGAR